MLPLRPDDPALIGDYRLLQRLGAGGMGRVYLGRSPGGRTVAIKVIRSEFADDPQFRQRFRREVDAARRVGGAWTAPVLDADPDAEQPWLVTAFVPGPSLHEAVRTHGLLPARTVRALGAGLAEALIAVHGAGLVHRDLKPSNVLLSLDGPRVIDFGISQAVDATTLTHTGAAIGSPAFMAPEQIGTGDVGPASDVFALGAVLVHAATGTSPFQAATVPAMMYAVLSREPDLAAVPDDLRDLIGACLRKDPGERPAPTAVLAALAPAGGAATLIAAGWLPATLVTALSRRAVALLDLDAPTRPPPPRDLSGTSPPHSTGIPNHPEPPAAITGPDASHGPRPDRGRTRNVPSDPRGYPPPGTTPPPDAYRPPGATPSPDAYRPPGATPRPDAFPPPGALPPPGATPRPGTGSAPGPLPGQDPLWPPAAPRQPATRRRRSRVLAVLAGAGAVGLALVALAVVLIVDRGSGGGSDGGTATAGGARSGATSGATAGAASGSGSGAVGGERLAGANPSTSPAVTAGAAVPAGYVGTWRGEITTPSGLAQNAVVTVHPGLTGQAVAHSEITVDGLTQADGQPIRCTADLRLVSISGGLSLQDIPGTGSDPKILGISACSHGGRISLLLQADGTVRFAADAPGTGNPTGTLIRDR
ncbi:MULTISPECIES: serine/threonine-protein kinase [Frankia]|uniref:serine/threonine-protein kinase n=1 Tax=Frankia TaxID=1854 RepID=UPI0002FAB9DE|nr:MULTISPECIES: serine/threonine protein kinase [Frankia]